jgi:hypothetical protein
VQFFHATVSKLNVGEFILPGFPAHEATGNQNGLVFFADDPATAEEWCWLMDVEGGEYEDKDINIYEVEPTRDYEKDRGVVNGTVNPGNFQSRYPLRIVGVVG